ncbi:uncharacterized protein Hap1MRO34_014691 [Clarias gariepinus]|uniref:DNA-binding protein K10 n=1 Tax=Clarias gariepinus TaxID=13013 RepID=UPI00234C1EC7|nr:DNA-binding protein K10 [Clarias gariepinus]
MEDNSQEQLEESSAKTETSKMINELKTAPGYKSRGHGVRGRGRGNHMGRGREGRETMMNVFGPQGRGRARNRNGFMNGFGPIRRGRGRSLPYMNIQGRKLGRADAMGMFSGPPSLPSSPPLPPRFLPPPLPMHLRGPHPPMHRHGPPPPPPPPPPGHSPFRGFPRRPRGRGMMPVGSHRPFYPRG